MGMNGGIHDAMNLAEKLSDIWFAGRSRILDRYTPPAPQGPGRFVQAQSIQNKKSLEEKDPACAARTSIISAACRRTSRSTSNSYRSSLFDSLKSANAVE